MVSVYIMMEQLFWGHSVGFIIIRFCLRLGFVEDAWWHLQLCVQLLSLCKVVLKITIIFSGYSIFCF